MIRDYTEMKWRDVGGKVLDVVAAYTSKLAYDGSGEVKRDSRNYVLARFSSGKRYNCDLNGAQNIAARGILKLTRRNDREDRSSKRPGRSPGSWACLCDLWDTAVYLPVSITTLPPRVSRWERLHPLMWGGQSQCHINLPTTFSNML